MNHHIIVQQLKQENKNAILSLQAGDYPLALRQFQLCHQIETALALTCQAAQTGMNIANVYRLLQQDDLALEQARHSLAYFSTQRSRRTDMFCARLLINRILVDLKQSEEARCDLHRLIRETSDQNIQAQAYELLSEIYDQADDWNKALQYISQAIERYAALDNPTAQSRALMRRSRLSADKGRPDMARIDRDRAARLVGHQV